MKHRLPVFPAVMTILAFISFAFVYFLITCYAVVPLYVEGLLFAVPFAVLLCFVLLAGARKLSGKTASVLTTVMSPVFVIGAIVLFFYLAFASSSTTNPVYYERTLRMSSVNNTPAAVAFPQHIPSNADDVFFSYNPQILQGSEIFTLAYVGDDSTVTSYESNIAEIALWTGTYAEATDANKNVIYPQNVRGHYEYNSLPDEYEVYLLYAYPDESGGHNHGGSCVVFINLEKNEIIIQYERW